MISYPCPYCKGAGCTSECATHVDWSSTSAIVTVSNQSAITNKRLKDRKTMYTDIDDTVHLWNSMNEDPNFNDKPRVLCRGPAGVESYITPYEPNLDKIRKYKFAGYNVIAWSAAGSEWAEAVMKALDMDRFVDLYIPKPNCYLDDLDCKHFMGKRIFMNEDGTDSGDK